MQCNVNLRIYFALFSIKYVVRIMRRSLNGSLIAINVDYLGLNIFMCLAFFRNFPLTLSSGPTNKTANLPGFEGFLRLLCVPTPPPFTPPPHSHFPSAKQLHIICLHMHWRICRGQRSVWLNLKYLSIFYALAKIRKKNEQQKRKEGRDKMEITQKASHWPVAWKEG